MVHLLSSHLNSRDAPRAVRGDISDNSKNVVNVPKFPGRCGAKLIVSAMVANMFVIGHGLLQTYDVLVRHGVEVIQKNRVGCIRVSCKFQFWIADDDLTAVFDAKHASYLHGYLSRYRFMDAQSSCLLVWPTGFRIQQR